MTDLISGISAPDMMMVVYLAGMSCIAGLAVIFLLSVRYYSKAKDLVPYMHKIKELAEKISELESKAADAEKLLKEKLSEVSAAEKQIQMGKDAEEWLKKSHEEIETTRTLLEKVRTEMETGKVQKEDLDRQISERQKTLVELEQKAVDAEAKVKECEKKGEGIRSESAELEAQIPVRRAELEQLKKEVSKLEERLAEVAKDVQVQTDRKNELIGESEKLSGVVAAKKAELDALNKGVRDATEIVEKKRKEVAELEGRAGVAQKTISSLAAQREEDGEKWRNLDTPVIGAMRNVSKDMPKETDWLRQFSGNLKNHGFIFDDRAIRAFHTGLKCASHTPLVVLAGISGTGKSLLPELYASALGMNFLPVPVQPRWDSPQDLFGFYNYMEGRYKATELSRLLWQFDRYNNPAAKKNYSGERDLPLNMVLLDEMNLARVEYYFSDLLSKLETRNGLDANNESERRKAEIELECNAAGKVDSMRHLFVAPHTLFVGTMNEDESTQTLSDKVIDRANVLRFGRPGMLGNANGEIAKEPDKSGFVQKYASCGRLSAGLWDGWCKGLDGTKPDAPEMRFLRETVTPVVEALDKVYRSYGFRVDKAMKLYVANYPGDYREAVADQIEMKILPKLNGVELQDENFDIVKNAMLTAIEATKDEKLRAAFEAACPDGGSFFKWRGVMR